mgnify:CR=1 FL=1
MEKNRKKIKGPPSVIRQGKVNHLAGGGRDQLMGSQLETCVENL